MDLNRNQQLAAIVLIGLALIGLSVAVAKPSFKGGSGSFTLSEPGRAQEGGADRSIADKPGASTSTPEATILIHVAGRVKFPNVYRLTPGSRVIDAVKAAGGSLPDAYLDAVNLAAKVKDGEQVYIPSRNNKTAVVPLAPAGQMPSTAASATPASSGASGKLKTPGSGYVNINSADSTELQRLPGVGPSTADKIIDYRSQIGRFNSVDQLVEVKGIGPKTLEKMRPFITL